MQEIHDEKRIESILRQESKYFQKRPQSVRLLQYEKGELLTQPLMPLRQFLLIVSGTVQIFGMNFLHTSPLFFFIVPYVTNKCKQICYTNLRNF